MRIIDDCEACDQKELCALYIGSHCLLVKAHGEELGIIGSD